tara:strand:- start:378 stop:866 length:489 start_codon:yes stop_codon:yes gene_type:complete
MLFFVVSVLSVGFVLSAVLATCESVFVASELEGCGSVVIDNSQVAFFGADHKADGDPECSNQVNNVVSLQSRSALVTQPQQRQFQWLKNQLHSSILPGLAVGWVLGDGTCFDFQAFIMGSSTCLCSKFKIMDQSPGICSSKTGRMSWGRERLDTILPILCRN